MTCDEAAKREVKSLEEGAVSPQHPPNWSPPNKRPRRSAAAHDELNFHTSGTTGSANVTAKSVVMIPPKLCPDGSTPSLHPHTRQESEGQTR